MNQSLLQPPGFYSLECQPVQEKHSELAWLGSIRLSYMRYTTGTAASVHAVPLQMSYGPRDLQQPFKVNADVGIVRDMLLIGRRQFENYEFKQKSIPNFILFHFQNVFKVIVGLSINCCAHQAFLYFQYIISVFTAFTFDLLGQCDRLPLLSLRSYVLRETMVPLQQSLLASIFQNIFQQCNHGCLMSGISTNLCPFKEFSSFGYSQNSQ